MNTSQSLINLHFSKHREPASLFPPVEVPANLAAGCINEYASHYNNGNLPYTSGVSFDKNELINWLVSLTNSAVYDKIEIQFGIYTQSFINHYVTAYPYLASEQGRITAFVRLYNGNNPATYSTTGAPVGLFNIGHLKP